MGLVQDGWNPIGGSMNAGDQKSTGIQNMFSSRAETSNIAGLGILQIPSLLERMEYHQIASNELTEMGIFQPEPGSEGAWHFCFFYP